MGRRRNRRNRELACKYAAMLMGNDHETDDWGQRLWSATVFFEAYLARGAQGTLRDFGPKKPTKLTAIGKGEA